MIYSHQCFRRKEYVENALISCAKEKESQIIRASSMVVERWIASHFAIPNAYLSLGNEFRIMEKKYGNWETTSPRHENSFVRIPTGGGNMRRMTVNANTIGGGDWPTYIACEGPTQESVYDFWALVWQEGINRILSVNFPLEELLYEQAYVKETAQYWPIVEGETEFYMPYKVTCVENRIMAGTGIEAKTEEDMVYRITRLILQLENNIVVEEPTREIIHMCYYRWKRILLLMMIFRWPDARIPIPWAGNKTTREAALDLFAAIKKEIRDTEAPLLVHCHAGIGRTGVVIATDMALQQLRSAHTVSVKDVVEQLRSKRPRSVMNLWQYALIHLMVAEVAAKERLCPATISNQPLEKMLETMWKEVDAEVEAYFGEDIVTYTPELKDK